LFLYLGEDKTSAITNSMKLTAQLYTDFAIGIRQTEKLKDVKHTQRPERFKMERNYTSLLK
jgi:hypothetical protein